MKRDLLYIGLIATTGTVGFLLGEKIGREEGFEEGLTIGRVRQLVQEGYSLQDINRILQEDMTEEEINHF